MKSDNRLIGKTFIRFVPVCIVFTVILCYLANNPLNIYVSSVLSILCAIIALFFHIFAKKLPALYIMSNLSNTVGAAFAVSIYYDVVSKALSLRDVLIMTLLHLLVFFVVDLLISASKKRKNAAKIFAVLLYVALLVFFTVQWIIDGSSFYSLGFFMTLLSFVYVLARVFINDENPEKMPKYLSVASFCGYLIIAVIVTFIILLIISEGEILEGLGDGLFEGIAELFCSIFESSNKKTKL